MLFKRNGLFLQELNSKWHRKRLMERLMVPVPLSYSGGESEKIVSAQNSAGREWIPYTAHGDG